MSEEIHNAYQMLELPDGAGWTQVQKSWRELMKVWHPDRFPHNPDLQREAEERTKQINNAYDILKRYLKDGDIPRPRPRSSKQSRKQESQKQTRQSRSRPRPSKQSKKQESQKRNRPRSRPRPSKQSRKQESQQRTRRPRSRPRPSKQSKKQESQKRTRQKETASEDAHFSQTHEQENRQEQTTKPKKENIDAKINGIFGIIFGIIFGAIIGFPSGFFISDLSLNLIDWMIEAVRGWSFIDRVNAWRETFPSKTLIIVTIIVTFLSRIIIDFDEDVDWFGYPFFGVCGGTIGCIIGNEMGSAGRATVIGAAVGARLACRWYVRGR